MKVRIWATTRSLASLKLAVVALIGMLGLATNANAAGYEVTLVGYKGQLQEIALSPSLWDRIQSKWQVFLIPEEGDPLVKVTLAKVGTLRKGEFSREVVRLVCDSEKDAIRMVRGLNGSIFRGDGLEIGFIRIGEEITFFEGRPTKKDVEINGFRGIMAEISAFTAWFAITHNAWHIFIDEGQCPSVKHTGWQYATTGVLEKGAARVYYTCVRLSNSEKGAQCLHDTDRLIEGRRKDYLMATQLGDKLMFIRGNVSEKDLLALVQAIPEVPGFDLD